VKPIKVIRIGAALLAGIVLMSSVALAATYSDVPSTHWAYAAISRVSERGLMLGDMNGNFNPDSSIDKFDTAKILAQMAGYKYTNVSTSETEYYNKAYEKNKTFLSQYAASFSKWNSTANREIAFLLEKEILTVEDLNQFVIRKNDGTEALRALSREEAAVFFVRLMGKKSEAVAYTDYYAFKDDSSISISSKPYVYYLRGMGVISGDPNNNYNPNSAVTRAAMAVMCNAVLDLLNNNNTGTVGTGALSSTNTAASVNNVATISGTIDKYFETLNAFQIDDGAGNKSIYKLSSSVSITVDGFLKTAQDLKTGMSIIGTVNNNELVSIKAQSMVTVAPSTVVPVTNTELSTVEGTVKSISTASATETISVEVLTINPIGQVFSEVRSYAVNDNCSITMDGDAIDFTDITIGAIVTLKVSGSQVHSISLPAKDVEIEKGTLLEKSYITTTGTPVLKIQDEDEKIYELRVTNNSYIFRKGIGECVWSELRIGDSVWVEAEYDEIIRVNATGKSSSENVRIQEIHITMEGAYIVGKSLSDNQVKTYSLIISTVDPYSLQVGSVAQLNLDSWEVETVNMVESAESGSVTGYIKSIRSSYFVIQDISSNKAIEVQFNNDTVFVNSMTGKRISYKQLQEDSKVYVIYSSSSSSLAKTVTVLS